MLCTLLGWDHKKHTQRSRAVTICLFYKTETSATVYLIQFSMKGTAELHVLDQIGPLPLVGCDNTNLIGFCSSLQEPGCYFFNIGGLSPAET